MIAYDNRELWERDALDADADVIPGAGVDREIWLAVRGGKIVGAFAESANDATGALCAEGYCCE